MACLEGARHLVADHLGPEDLLPKTLSRSDPATVLISHPHQDHYGLLEETPHNWPVYSGQPSEKLIRLSARVQLTSFDVL